MRKQKTIDEVMVDLTELKKSHGGDTKCSMIVFIHKDANGLIPVKRGVGDAIILDGECVIRSR